MLNKKLMIVLMSCASLMTSAQVTLDSCRHMALRNNKQMGIEQLKIEQAGYQRKQAQAAYKPSIDFAGTYMHTGRNVSLGHWHFARRQQGECSDSEG